MNHLFLGSFSHFFPPFKEYNLVVLPCCLQWNHRRVFWKCLRRSVPGLGRGRLRLSKYTAALPNFRKEIDGRAQFRSFRKFPVIATLGREKQRENSGGGGGGGAPNAEVTQGRGDSPTARVRLFFPFSFLKQEVTPTRGGPTGDPRRRRRAAATLTFLQRQLGDEQHMRPSAHACKKDQSRSFNMQLALSLVFWFFFSARKGLL